MGARRNSLVSKAWLSERREVLQKIKDQVHLYLGEEPEEVTRYALAYKADILRPWRLSNRQELFESLKKCSIVLGGDFHPFAQAQRAHLRILRKLGGSRPLTLAVECFAVSDQVWVDRYMSGEISESDFLQQVAWEEKWGFPWAHYRPLFDWARKNSCPVLALNVLADGASPVSLDQRDGAAARAISEYRDQHPDHLIYVLYGDLHIASSHLPRHLESFMGEAFAREHLRLYLNVEKIYFQLAEAHRESDVELVRFTENEFCLLSSPPWVKWQSYLMYLEENFDVELEFDDDEDEEGWDFEVDYTDHVAQLVGMICRALGVEMRTDDIEVYTGIDEENLNSVLGSLAEDEAQLILDMVRSDKGFYVPSEGFFYLSKSTVNHAAALAGQYVHGKLCSRQVLGWEFPDRFLQSIWIESMSFLLSKFINPKRKAQTMKDLKKQLEAFEHGDKGREPLLLALDHKMSELLHIYAQQEKNREFIPRDRSSYLHAARFIGEMLGERYFILYQSRILGIDEIRALLSQSLNLQEFHDFYYRQLKKLDYLEGEKQE